MIAPLPNGVLPCLRSLAMLDYPSARYEVLVVDKVMPSNASRRGTEINLSAVYAYGVWRPAFGIQGTFDATAFSIVQRDALEAKATSRPSVEWLGAVSAQPSHKPVVLDVASFDQMGR